MTKWWVYKSNISRSLRHRKAVHSTNTWPVVHTVNATGQLHKNIKRLLMIHNLCNILHAKIVHDRQSQYALVSINSNTQKYIHLPFELFVADVVSKTASARAPQNTMERFFNVRFLTSFKAILKSIYYLFKQNCNQTITFVLLLSICQFVCGA